MALNHRNVVVLCTLFTVLAAWEGVHGAGSHVRLGASHSDKIRGPRADTPAFTYDDVAAWAGECQTGKMQSPVDIVISETQHMDLPTPLEVPDFVLKKEASSIQNDGTTVKVFPKEAPTRGARADDLVVRGGPLTGDYKLDELHFHWGADDDMGSEHTIDSKYYAMEMHMVFTKAGGGRRASRDESGNTAILAVFLELADVGNPAVAVVLSQISELIPTNEKPLTPKEDISITDLLPANREALLVYDGSLTTPLCTEGVTWIIFEEPITVSADQVKQFRTLKVKADGSELLTNRRPVQDRNDRVFYSTVERGVAVAVQVWPSLALFCIISVCTVN